MRLKNIFLKVLIFIILPSILIETFIFNIRFYESLFYKNSQTIITNTDEIIVDNYKKKIIINNINTQTKNLYIDFDSTIDNFEYTIYAKDKGNKEYFELPTRTYNNNINNSKYIKMNLSGKTKALKIKFNYNKHKSYKVKINNIKSNVIKPFNFSIERFTILLFIFIIFYIFRFKSRLYKIKLFDSKNKIFNKISIGLFIFLEIILLYSLTDMNPLFKNPIGLENQRQYNNLAISLANKKVNIDKEVGPTLKNLKNPYDYKNREKELEKNHENYLWDYAFFNNKYYVYFGIVPEIIAYLPYYLITGNQLSNATYTFIVLVLIFILVLLNIYNLAKKYFKETKTLHYLLLCAFAFNSSFLLYVSKRPDFYSMPIISAILFSLLGIYLWSTSINNNKINKKKLFLGSLSMALVAGCRPQLVLGSFLCFIIFKEFINKKNIKEIIIFIIPYIIVALPLMYYNYIRFNSPFDFGANYNLTYNDMTVRGFRLDRIFLGLYYTLFYRNPINLVFPFIEYSNIKTQYMGLTISEASAGGMIINNLIMLFGLLSFKFKKIINNTKLYLISLLSILFTIILIIVDTQMAGILIRYILDYSWLLIISTIIVVLSLLNNIKNIELKTIVEKLIIVLVFLSLIYNFMLIPFDYSYSIQKRNPNLYYKISNLVQFWL